MPAAFGRCAGKRQRELLRMEKQREKAARRAQPEDSRAGPREYSVAWRQTLREILAAGPERATALHQRLGSFNTVSRPARGGQSAIKRG